MATKEVATGVIVSGGAGGTGYAVYYVMSPSTVEDVILNDYLLQENKSYGKPMTKAEESEGWWKKGTHRYILEVGENNKLNDFDGKKFREEGTFDKSNEFKKACEEVLNKSKSDNEALETAKKWCVTYKTIAEDDENKNKELAIQKDNEDHKKTEWKTKYESSTTGESVDEDIKKTLENIKKKDNGSDDEDKKKAKAMQEWCKAAWDASSSGFKSKFNSKCELSDKSSA